VHGEGPTSSAGRPGRSNSGLQTLALSSCAQVAVELTAWLVQLYISVQLVMASCVFWLNLPMPSLPSRHSLPQRLWQDYGWAVYFAEHVFTD
jgi:hypothetical protein